MEKIKVQIFGIEDQKVDSACGLSNGCGGCGNHGCKACGRKDESQDKTRTMENSFEELANIIKNSDVDDAVSLEFIDINKLGSIHPYDYITDLIDRGFELPITVVDGIVRYYGGISGKLIYRDVLELLP